MIKMTNSKSIKEIENEKDPCKKKLLQYDYDWCLSHDKERYDYVLRRSRQFMYENQWIEIKRRCYYDKLNKEYVYPLDRMLGIEKYQHIANENKQSALEMVAINKMTLNQVKVAFGNCISAVTIHNLIKSQIPNIVTYSITNPQLYKFIFIDIDDTYLHLRVNNKGIKYKFRMIHSYQEYDWEHKHFLNEIKMVIVTQYNVLEVDEKSWTLKQINTLISKNYGDRSNFKVYVSSDGARDLKAIADGLGAIHALDRYHAINWVEHTFKTEQLKQINWMLNNSSNRHAHKINLKEPIRKLVEAGKVDEAICKLAKLKENYPFASRQIGALIKYLQNNKESIMTWQDPNYCGSYTETFVQQLVKSYFGNTGRCFSKDTFIKMLQTRCWVVF